MSQPEQNNSILHKIDEAGGRLVIGMITGLVSLISGQNRSLSADTGAGKLPRRMFVKKAAALLAPVALMTFPFAFARMLVPGAGRSIDPKTADKSKRNIYHRNRRNILRPPGALQDQQKFAAACIGCGLCGEVCPPRCIKFHARDGGNNANTPFINASERACILCNKCMEVCPTEALGVMPRKDIDMGIAQIDRSACYPWVDRGICGACVAICPLGKKAISHKEWNQYQPIVHSACVGCGLCVEICPHPSTPIWIVDRRQGSVAKHRI